MANTLVATCCVPASLPKDDRLVLALTICRAVTIRANERLASDEAEAQCEPRV
jgi:hypothetical protein